MGSCCPRLVIAGTGGDSGKTLVALGLLSAWRHAGLPPAAFKKGPDYIDAAWLGWAAGDPCHNLDTFLQPDDRLKATFVRRARRARVSVIEGNRGIHDGMDADGTHSTATLARLLDAPVVLVVSARKVTRTVAAVVLGCQQLDPEVRIAGVVLNHVAGARHERMVRRSVERLCGVEVVGAIPRIETDLLPDRHLGLVPPQEHRRLDELEPMVLRVARGHLDLDRLLEIARAAPAPPGVAADPAPPAAAGPRVRVGVFSDSAFTFYYPENLDALREAGAELTLISGQEDRELPEVDALYLGGGFPETHAPALAANVALHQELREAARAGMPIYAECGGMIFLARSLTMEGVRHPMAGVLPVDLELFQRPQGHGYVELEVDRQNPFFEPGTRLRGHEFHYTRVVGELPLSAFKVSRGTGCGGGRDGLVRDNVLAAYTHLHATGTPEWAAGLVHRAREWRG